jgi:hypothetical protein
MPAPPVGHIGTLIAIERLPQSRSPSKVLSVSPRSAMAYSDDEVFDGMGSQAAAPVMQERLRVAAGMLQAMEVQIHRAESAIAALSACQRQARRLGAHLHAQSLELSSRADAMLRQLDRSAPDASARE